MCNGVMIKSLTGGGRWQGATGARWGPGEGEATRQAERMQALLSLGAYDIEQQRQSIRSNIQQARLNG